MLKNSPPGADQRPKSVFSGGALGVRTIIVGLLAIGTLIAASVTALVLGFEIGYRELPGFDLLRRLDRRVEIMVSSNHPDKLTDSVYETTLLRVVADVGLVEVSANGQSTGQATGLGAEGGGLTSFGPDVLLLPYDGQIARRAPPTTSAQPGCRRPTTIARPTSRWPAIRRTSNTRSSRTASAITTSSTTRAMTRAA